MRTARLCCALNSAILTVLLSWASPASAGVDNPTPENFLRRPFPNAVALGGYVYIDGGELSQLENGTIDGDHPSWAVNTTLSLPLTTSWTNDSVTLRSIPKSAPSQDQQVLWSDPSTSSFYTWGGTTAWFGAAAENVIWKFAADDSGGGEWSQATASNVVAFTNSIRTVGSAFTTVNGVGYSLGGLATSGSDTSITGSLAVQGMVTFDLASLEWNNASSAGLGVNGTTMNAQLEYAPFGPSGFLVLLGGDALPVGALSEYEELDWNSVWVMDLKSKTWYNQAITGSKPTKREDMCSVGVQGPNGTYEIFVYGGASSQTSSTASDVYVLSLPGFVMFKSPNPGTPRQNHACLTIGRNSSASATNRQMLVVGGTNGWLGFPNSLEDPDPWKQGLGVLDLTELTWSSSYDPDAAAYDSPDVVKTWYSQGGLDTVSWTNNDLKTLFVGGTNSSNTNANGTSSSSSSSSNSGSSSGGGNNSSDSSSSGTNHTGAIAGGVVGGIAALAAIALLCWYLLRRRRNKTKYAAASQQPPELAGGDPHQQQQFHSPGYYPSEPKPELWTVAPHATELSADQRPSEMEGNHGSMYELPDQQVGGLRHGNGGGDVPQQTYTGGPPHYPGGQEVFQQDHYGVPGEQGHGQNGGYGFYGR